jgi:hypothetical protein
MNQYDQNKANDIFNKFYKQKSSLSQTHKGNDRITQDDIERIRAQEKIKAEKRKIKHKKLAFWIVSAILASIIVIYIAEKISHPTVTGEICTYRTNTYPADELKVYAVGTGQDQKVRRDMFIADHDIFGSGRNRHTEHAIVNDGMTYTWNEGDSSGYKFPNAPLPFREYFNLQEYDLKCKSAYIDASTFEVPKNIYFKIAKPNTSSAINPSKKAPPPLSLHSKPKPRLDIKKLEAITMKVAPDLIGHWRGNVKKTGVFDNKEYPVDITIRAGNPNDNVGAIYYSTLDCKGYLILNSASSNQIAVQEIFTKGSNVCVTLTKTSLTLETNGALKYNAKNSLGSSSAVLRKVD